MIWTSVFISGCSLTDFSAFSYVLSGGHSAPLAEEADAEWQDVLPDAELVVIPGGSHLLLDEFPAAVDALRTFLKA